jgi:hypothetical protein
MISPASLPDAWGRFGPYGGKYAPEVLMPALEELEGFYAKIKDDPAFKAELDSLLRDFVGRPSPLYYAERLTEHCKGAKVYLKREDLNHTGAHKINNAIGQVLIARRMGKKRIIAETGAGQHGVATATICARCSCRWITKQSRPPQKCSSTSISVSLQARATWRRRCASVSRSRRSSRKPGTGTLICSCWVRTAALARRDS